MISHESNNHGAFPSPASREPWEPMMLRYAGHVRELVQGGGGKLSTSAADPGDGRKTKPSG